MPLRELDDAERALYFRGVQPIWGGGLEEERFVAFQRRLAASPEAAGRYRLLGLFSEHGGLLSAVKAYELDAEAAGRGLRVLGIGAVWTPPELRSRGHAATMLRLLLAEYQRRGAQAALLFSDIGTAYYEKLGFHALRSEECTVDVGALPALNGYRPAAPGDEAQLTRLLRESRTPRSPFTLQRDGWVLRFQLRRLRELARARYVGEPEWGILVDGRDGRAGCMLRHSREAVDVLDAAWTTDAARQRLLGGLRDCLVRSGRRSLRVWPAHQLRGLFPAAPRTGAVSMIAPLAPGLHLPGPGGEADLTLLDHI